MTAEELQSEWRLWDAVNNVGSPRPMNPASASFCKFVVEVVIPRELLAVERFIGGMEVSGEDVAYTHRAIVKELPERRSG